jgi:hypothetical protein
LLLDIHSDRVYRSLPKEVTMMTKNLAAIFAIVMIAGCGTAQAKSGTLEAREATVPVVAQGPSVVNKRAVLSTESTDEKKVARKKRQRVPRHVPIVYSKYEKRIKPSKYHGKWFDKKYESIRRCIVWRESNGRYHVVNGSSGSAGAYQFMPSTWRANSKYGGSASDYKRKIQDHIFWKVWNRGHGRMHWWYGQRYPCW